MASDTSKATETTCPECGADGFGEWSGEPIQGSGWYGNARFAWGRYAGVHMQRCTAKRCPKCGHTEAIDPQWDDT